MTISREMPDEELDSPVPPPDRPPDASWLIENTLTIEWQAGDPGLLDPGLLDPALLDPALCVPGLSAAVLTDSLLVEPALADA
ncbi:hypothetical protein, partial [Cryobacterium melibiosiphilum]